ncbi:hypothetical protein DL764_007754 [Monosporascus ibericus]|uniref:Caleosin domain-containing protein n=1 Tax=Monosporascus ibericus TaxID=155417 RepID=A0A4V1X9G2_9PEZI|nr:hypothetical protein DL764_007754 [Monosporascus ibericus]
MDGQTTPDVVTSIPEVPVTQKRVPFVAPADDDRLPHMGVARANVAATYQKPEGTTEDIWAERHKDQTVLQQHCDFFDSLGFGIILSWVAMLVIHINFSYPTVPGYLPDPFFRVFINNIHKDIHGSDTGTYDSAGRFVPQNFEDIFAKYANGRDYMTAWDLWNVMKGQRDIADPIGWGAAFFEWLATYLFLWPADGRMMKEDIRRIYDGSIFHTVADRRSGGK